MGLRGQSVRWQKELGGGYSYCASSKRCKLRWWKALTVRVSSWCKSVGKGDLILLTEIKSASRISQRGLKKIPFLFLAKPMWALLLAGDNNFSSPAPPWGWPCPLLSPLPLVCRAERWCYGRGRNTSGVATRGTRLPMMVPLPGGPLSALGGGCWAVRALRGDVFSSSYIDFDFCLSA